MGARVAGHAFGVMSQVVQLFGRHPSPEIARHVKQPQGTNFVTKRLDNAGGSGAIQL
jgi:hypothetical protein